MKWNNLLKIVTLLLVFSFIQLANAGDLEYETHRRGMLHETVFNDGNIGRPWTAGESGNNTSVPLMEWPPYSRATVDGIEYSGQHNILGAGMYMAGNLASNPGKTNRIYSFCGGVGASEPETATGKWSFPLSLEKITNYPLLETGGINPDFDPNEAEEIIIAKWASSIGVTVTRTSRQFSHPDFDDMIIYEYELEYTGDTDGDPTTIEQTETLRDFMALFVYGFAPSMYGYQRLYLEWKYNGGIYRGDQNNYWDADYWLGFNLNLRSNLKEEWAKAEPDKELFLHNAETGDLGGGLNSPQAPGFCILHYDTTHLAVVDPNDSTRNESEFVDYLRSLGGEYFELDEKGHVKQPFSNKVTTGNTNHIKMQDYSINPDKRWSGVYSEGSTYWVEMPNNDPRWYGRGAFNFRQSADAGQKHTVFGPYTLEHGQKVEFAIAEVIGYGAEPNKRVEGGPPNSSGTLVQWNTTPSWDRIVKMDGVAWTDSGYISQYGYPDYVNSEVRTVTQVAQKAFEAYLGDPDAQQPFWPEDHPKDGLYEIPILVPAPAIFLSNTPLAEVRLVWSRAVESFDVEGQTGQLDHFNVYRSLHGYGPWKLLATINKGDVTSENVYEYLDQDQENFKLGEDRYYAVTSVDEHGNESGKTNLVIHEKNLSSVETLGKVYAVPNPFVYDSGFEGTKDASEEIIFYGLTENCTIRVFSYSGQLVWEYHHNAKTYTNTGKSFVISNRNNQYIASGVYFYVVTADDGRQSSGKLVIVR